MKIVTILGARPQFIKAGSVSRVIAHYPQIHEVIVHTGQHYDSNMSEIFFEEMHLPKPDYFLGIGGKSHGAMTGQMIEKIEEVLLRERPDWVLIYGDTNSTLAGALAASKLHIKIAHVEAGLRSFNMQMPEEINRIVSDRLSTLLFCPTKCAVENLYNEGFEYFTCKVIHSGDVMYDGALFYEHLARKPFLHVKNHFILATLHRAENTDNEAKIRIIFAALNTLGVEHQIVLPLHPRTKKIIERLNIDTCHLTLINPVGYLEMVWLIKQCRMVITDSGGLQKEAYFFEKPCVTLRDQTEWRELVSIGVNVLVEIKQQKIIKIVKEYVNVKVSPLKTFLYGDGKASEMIIKSLLDY